MENNIEACLVCGADQKYHNTAREMECKYCHRTFMSKTECVNGHYVCDECHSNPAMIDIRNFCLASKSSNPIEIATGLIRQPSVHMHGPEHDTLVGSALLTAYKNARGKLESLDDALAEMANRESKVPGGACGFWGACGAGISSGMFVSIITGSTPLSRKPWGMSNVMTSRSLQAIGAIDGPDATQHPCGRVGNPQDIAQMVLFLCSDKAGFITGENICIDGGMTRLMIYHNDNGWKMGL